MVQITQESSTIIKQMLDNSEEWHSGVELDGSLKILERHSKLMVIYQDLPDAELTEKEAEQIRKLFSNIKQLMVYLDTERDDLFDKISLMNQSEKIATQYIKQFSESYFIDKDF